MRSNLGHFALFEVGFAVKGRCFGVTNAFIVRGIEQHDVRRNDLIAWQVHDVADLRVHDMSGEW